MIKTPEKNTRKAGIRAENERIILIAAEEVFAEHGFGGATMALVAERAGVPKPNIHYYFNTKEELYRRVIESIFTVWVEAANALGEKTEPTKALTHYIHTKMDLAQKRPYGSKVWANEIIQGAPVIQDYLETTLKEWVDSVESLINSWIKEGKLRPIKPKHLLYLIWASTQHYADFGHQIKTLNGGQPFSNVQWEEAKRVVTEIILNGVVLK